MALPGSGQIDLNAIHIEAGGPGGSYVTINDADVRSLIGAASGQSNLDFAEFYGASGVISGNWGSIIFGSPTTAGTTSATVSGSGTITMTISGVGTCYIRKNSGSYSTGVSGSGSVNISVSDGDSVQVRWVRSSDGSATITLKDGADTIDAITCSRFTI